VAKFHLQFNSSLSSRSGLQFNSPDVVGFL
jgi:hypothetical protein